MLRRLLWAAAATALIAGCGAADDFSAEELESIEQGLRVAVPARIQAESYDRANELTPTVNSGNQCNRSDGVDMELTTDTGGGCNVGWTDAGEWLEYDISVASEAYFSIIARVASNNTTRTLRVELDGASLGALTSPSSGWQSWADRSWVNIKIPAGNHTLRVVFENGSVNLNYVELTQNAASCTDGIKNGSETGVDCGGSCKACATGCVEQVLTPSNPSASSVETSALSAAMAVDGIVSSTSRWSSAFSDPQWLMVDLGAQRKVSRVVLNWEAAYSSKYDVQVADSTSGPWTNLFSTEAGNGGVDDLTGLSGKGRYLRMYSRARGTAWGNSLYELTTYGDPNPNCSATPLPTCTDGLKNGSETDVDCGGSCSTKCANGKICASGSDCSSSYCGPNGLCAAAPSCSDGVQNGTETGIDCGGSCPACPSGCVEQALARPSASASSVESASYPASLAIDGNTSSSTSRWSSLFSDPQWLIVDLGAQRKVSRVHLYWEAAYSGNYDVQVGDSTSGPWTTLYATTTGNGGEDNLTGLSGKGRYVRVYSRSRATQWGNSLFEVLVYGDNNPNCSAPNGTDTDGDRLPDSAETGTNVFVSASNAGTSATNPDTDADGIRDGDEVLGTSGGLNLPGMGLNPLRKNILLEFDWFDDALDCGQHSHKPNPTQIDRVATAFANSPVTNPDGSHGITLIQDWGQGGLFTGGNFINDADGIVDTLGTEFYAYKASHFASNRSGYFHYVIMAHQYGSRDNGSSGVAWIVGEDFIVSLACWGDDIMIANTIMHELGHNLGLHHGGPNNDATNYKPNYASVMNYSYQFPGVDTNCISGGDGLLDYSRKTHNDLNENALNESEGICGGVDWDFNFNSVIETNVSWDVNSDGIKDVLRDYDDWSSIVYDFNPSMGANALMSVKREMVSCDAPPAP
jgi:hypothetical protein